MRSTIQLLEKIWNRNGAACVGQDRLDHGDKVAGDRGNPTAGPFVATDDIGSTKLLAAKATTCCGQEMPGHDVARDIHALHELTTVFPIALDRVPLVPDKVMICS